MKDIDDNCELFNCSTIEFEAYMSKPRFIELVPLGIILVQECNFHAMEETNSVSPSFGKENGLVVALFFA